MRVIVIGASRLGVALVETLLEGQHDVVLVDESRQRLDDLADRLDCGFIEGDGTLPQILRDAYGDGADALALMTNHDDVNILSAVVGRSIGYERIVLQIVRAQLLDVCEELGFEDVVTPHVTLASSIAQSLENHERVWSELSIADGIHFANYEARSKHVGQKMGAVEVPDGARVVAVLRDGDVRVDPEAELSEGDELLVAVVRDVRDELHEAFGSDD